MSNLAQPLEFRPIHVLAGGDGELAGAAEITRAVFVTQAQEKFLQKACEALDRMVELAILSQQSAPESRALCLEEFETLISFLEKLAETEIDGIQLFRTPHLIVATPEPGDTLVLPGIDFNDLAFRRALSARINEDSEVSAALAALQNATRWLAIGRSLVSTNLGRLAFLDQRTDKLKHVVLPLWPASAQELHPVRLSGRSARSRDNVLTTETQRV